MIEQSIDGTRFNSLTNVSAKGRANNNYSATVADASNSFVYYRLKIVDNDGKSFYECTCCVGNDRCVVVKINGCLVINSSAGRNRRMWFYPERNKAMTFYFIHIAVGQKNIKELKENNIVFHCCFAGM